MPGNELAQSLDRLAGAIGQGNITLSEGVGQIKAQAGPLLSPEAVKDAAEQECSRFLNHPDDQPLTWWQLLFAAIDSGDPAMRRQYLVAATIPYLYAASAACQRLPDGQTFAEARRRGEAAVTAAQEIGPGFAESEILHRLGVLCLDPFTIGRTPANYANEDANWRRRLEIVRGRYYASQDGAAMPPSAPTVGESIDYLDRALTLRTDQPRGFTLKALCIALMWHERLGGPADHARIAALAIEASPLLPPEYRQEMRRFAEDFGGRSMSADGEVSLWSVPPEEVFNLLGPRVAADRYRVAASELARTDPAKAFDLILCVWPLLLDESFVEERLSLASTFANAALVHAQKLGLACVAAKPRRGLARMLGFGRKDHSDISALDTELVRRAKAENWDLLFFAAARLGIAVSTQPLDREGEALPLLRSILAMREGSVPPALHNIVALLQAHLQQAAGVNAYRANDFAEATQRYAESTYSYASQGYADQALSTLQLAEEAAERGDARVKNTMIVGLARVTPEVAKLGGGPLAVHLRASWERVMANAFGLGDGAHRANLEALVLALQAAKGATFAVRLSRGATWDWRKDEDTLALLNEIEGLRDKLPPASRPQVALSDNVVLASYDSDFASEETGELGRLRRLRQRLDLRLLRGTVGNGSLLEACATLDALQGRIGADTVLLTQYVGKTTDGQVALVSVLFTEEGAQAETGLLNLPTAQIEMEADGMKIQAGWFTLPVAALRDALMEDPGSGGIVGEKAQRELSGGLSHLLLGGGLPQKLGALRAAGKTHICINAHEALHFVPMHLMGSGGRILADDWTVTTVPHFAALAGNHAALPVGDLATVSAFGLNYPGGVPHGQAELKRAEAEAAAIAKVMGGDVYPGPAATEDNFIAALQTSRRIHVACHGAIEVGAPAFHCLFLNPAGYSDGVLHAYELEGRDLSHIDLVTLSACETGLGRFDALDNMRGMPATLMVCGVATVISTLWPVRDRAAETFFVHLYGRLVQGATKVAAFRSAQLETRSRFPAYRDWAAFTYSGAW